MAVDASRDAVEQLVVVRHASGVGMGTRTPRDYVVTVSVQDCIDTTATLRALLARAEAAEVERDEAHRQWQNYEAAAVERQAQRDAAIAERDRLAEALGRFLNDAEPCRDFGEWFEACCKKASAALASINKGPTDGE